MKALVGALVLALASVGTASAQSTGGAEDNLKQKNIVLPPPVTPVANYVPAVRVGMAELPFNIPVEIEMILEVEQD
jgi:hypothetical protein